MLNRLTVSLSLALLGLFTRAGAIYAADSSDRDEVLIGTSLVALGVMLFLLVVYLIKHSLGLNKMEPAPAEAEAHH